MRLTKLWALALVMLIIASNAGGVARVEAQVFPLNVTSSLATVGGELGFMLNRTLLDHAHPVKSSPILYFWLSTNKLSHVNGSELRIAVLNVGSAPLVYGTLLVPLTALAWVKAQTVKAYLKISVSPDVGAPAVVSDRAFTLVLDLNLTDPTLAVLDGVTGAAQNRFAYYRFFNISDSIVFNVNLTPLLDLGVKSSELDSVKVYNVTLTHRDQMLYASLDVEGEGVYANFLRVITGSGTTRLAIIRGLIGDFPLLYPERPATVAGIPVAYQPFNVTLTAYAEMEVRGGLKVDRGVVRGVLHRDTWRAPIASAMEEGWLELYPSINYSFATDRPGVSTTFHLDARNFRPGVYTLALLYRSDSPLGPYVMLPNTRSIALVVDGSGRGSASASLPDNPYGGRFTLITVSLGGLDSLRVLAKPGDRVYPHLAITGFNNEGTPGVEPRFTPGEYILVHGRGWLDVPFEAMTATIALNGIVYTLEAVESRGVDRNGALAAILKVPPNAMLPAGFTVTFNLSTDRFNSYVLAGVVRYVEPLVYVQPRPVILRVAPGLVDARINLGADRFPYTAFWEPEQLRRYTVEAIALPPGATVTLSLKPANLTIRGLNETGLGYLRVEAPVPEVPQGVYTVRASWGYFDYVESSPRREHSLRIWATVAVVIPTYGRIALLPSPYDVTVKGVGFAPQLRVYYDIPRLGLYNVSIIGLDGDVARASDRGTFIGYIPLSTIARAPGTYVIQVHQRPDNGTVVAELTVTIGVPPPLTVEVRVAPLRYADERVGIWITAFYGGIIASSAQVPEANVRVTLILRWAGGFKEAELAARSVLAGKAVFLAEFTPIRVFGADVLGGEVFVVVSVTGRYAPGQQEDHATTTALITVPSVTLASLVEAIQTTPRALAEILEVARRVSANTDRIVALLTEQGALMVNSLAGIEAKLGMLEGDVTLVKLSLDSISRNLSELYTVTLRIDGSANATLATLRVIRGVLESVENVVIAVKGDTIAIRTIDVPRVLEALASLNKTIIGTVTLEIEGVRVAVGDLRSAVTEGFKAISDSIATSTLATVGRLEIVQRSLTRLAETSTTVMGMTESTSRDVAALRGAIESLIARMPGLEARVSVVESKVDEIAARLDNLSGKEDVERARAAVVDEVRGAQATLFEELRVARETITSSTRNFALLNAILILLAIALAAYTLLLVRRMP